MEKEGRREFNELDQDDRRAIVKREFLLDYTGKDITESGKYKTLESLSDVYNNARAELDAMTDKELNSEIISRDPKGGPKRIERCKARDWYEDEISLDKIGSWPKMRGLPIEATTGNFRDVAAYVAKYFNREGDKEFGKVPGELRKALERLRDNPDVLKFALKNTRTILYEGTEVRDTDYNRHAEKHGRSERCKIYDWTADNGNVKDLAAAMFTDRDKVRSYVGVPGGTQYEVKAD